MISTEIPFVNYVFITITAGVMAFVTLMDEGTVINKEDSPVAPDAEGPSDIFSSVSSNDNNDSAFNSLPSIFNTSENVETEVPPPQPISDDTIESQDTDEIPIAEPLMLEPETLQQDVIEVEEQNKPPQGGYKKKTKRKVISNRKTKRK